MSDVLPSSWELCKFGDIAKIRNGYAFKSIWFKETKELPTDIPLIRQSQLKGPVADLSDTVFLDASYLNEFYNYRIQYGDVLIGMSGSIGKVCVYKEEQPALQNQRTGKIEVCRGAELDPKFLGLYLSSIERTLVQFAKGMGVQNISSKDIEALPFALPPLSEQHRIVAKIEELFSELDAGVENLKKARAQLAVYRQALLKHAFEGRLTAEWRAKHADELETDSAEQLLARIRAEREKRYEEDLRAWNNRKGKGEFIHNGELLTKPRKPKPPYRLEPDEMAKLRELPKGWKWMTFESLSSPAQRSIQSGPFGSSLKHSEFSEEGMLVIGIDNVQKGYFSKGSQNRIPPKTYERLRKYSARPHDVLMTVMATVGRCCSVPEDLETAIITKHVYRTSPNLNLVMPSFVVGALLGCPATVKAVEKDKIGQTRPGINGDILKWLPIPLPSLEEQEEIMRIVNASLEGLAALEADIDQNLQRAEALRQSILKKAFAGELVPQDPADEPAAELLARIRAEREAGAGVAKAGKPRKIKTA